MRHRFFISTGEALLLALVSLFKSYHLRVLMFNGQDRAREREMHSYHAEMMIELLLI